MHVLLWRPVRALRTGGPIELGAFCSLARDVHILGGGEHARPAEHLPFRTALSRADEGEWDVFAKGPTRIGNDVWLGFGATVLSGSRIGDGAIVAARAVVGGVEIPPYAIVVGNPGRIVAYRFDEPTIARLLALRWWDSPDERIAEMEPYFYAGVEAFLTQSEERFGPTNRSGDRSNPDKLRPPSSGSENLRRRLGARPRRRRFALTHRPAATRVSHPSPVRGTAQFGRAGVPSHRPAAMVAGSSKRSNSPGWRTGICG